MIQKDTYNSVFPGLQLTVMQILMYISTTEKEQMAREKKKKKKGELGIEECKRYEGKWKSKTSEDK